MYKTNSHLKQEARQALSGKWGIAVLMTMFTGVVSYSFSITSSESITVSIVSLIGTVLNILISVGITSFMLKICCNQKESASFKDIFYGFQCHPGKAILLYLLEVLYLLPGSVIFGVLLVVACMVFLFSSGITAENMLFAMYTNSYANFDASVVITLTVIIFLLFIAYMVYAFYITATYSMVYFLLLDYPDLSVTEIWKRSAKLMKGNRFRYFKLLLSFVPWAIASIFTLFIGLLWLEPYMNAACTEFYLDLVQNQAYSSREDTYTSASNLTHDCETAHDDIFSEEKKTYTGIDPDTFK